MVVIDRYSPLGPAAEAVGSYFTAKRQRAVDDAALAHTAEREKRSDMESDRSFGLEKNADQRAGIAASDAHSLVPGQMKIQQGDVTAQGDTHAAAVVQRQIDLQTLAYNRALQPLQLEHQKLENKISSGQVVSASDTHRMSQLEMQLKQVEAAHAEQMAQLSAQLQQAQISETRASAVRDLRAPARASASEIQADAFNNAENSLSPEGQSFLDMISSSNNPPTRMQALRALAVSRLPGSDKKALQTIIESRESSFETPGQQNGEEYRSGRDTTADTRYENNLANKQGEQLYQAISKGKNYNAMSPIAKGAIHTLIVLKGRDIPYILDHIDSSKVLSSEDKDQIKQVLGGT